MPNVSMLSPEGDPYSIPAENLAAAQGQGFKPATMMTNPEGEGMWVPRENAAKALQQGFKVGQPVKEDQGPMPTSYADARRQGVTNVVDAFKNFGKGALETLNPLPQPGENAGILPQERIAGRMVKGIIEGLSGAPQVPAAVQDINASSDPTGYYGQAASKTAADLAPQALAAAAMEGVGDPAVGNAAKAAGQVVKKVATPENIGAAVGGYVGHQVGEGLGGAFIGREIGKAVGKSLGKSAEAPKPIITDPAEIQARVQELAKPKEAPAAPKTETPQTVGTAAGAVDDTALFQKAKTELGDAPISKVAKRAQELKDQSASFEKTFGQPLSSFLDASGKFDMKEFLGAVVKPGTEPPAYVISRAFGADGVDLIREISGKPIEKWESMGPLKAERNAAKIQSKDVSPDAEGGTPSSKVEPAKGDRMLKQQDPALYMKMSGADEGSVLKSQKDIDTVNHFRQQFKEGKNVPPSELRMEPGQGVLEADGRHRALAAKLEGKKLDVILRRRPLSGVKQ